MPGPQDPETPQLVAHCQASSDPKAKEALVKRYLYLVRQIAAGFSHRSGETFDDLVQVGCIGLLLAIDRYDPLHGASFEAYAASLIAGEMRHHIRDHGALVRPPRDLLELRRRVSETTQHLSNADLNPTPEKIAELMGLTLEKVVDAQALDTTPPLSLDQENADGSRYQLIDNRYKSFQLALEDRIMVTQALESIGKASRDVIEFAFYQDLTQTEIAKRMGVSQMQVSRRLRSALKELWKVLNSPIW